jgi:hypothetical protein
MGKRLKFLYRYFTTSYRWRRWLNLQVLIVLVASVVFFAALFMTAPLSAKSQQPAVTATLSVQQTPTVDLLVTPTITPMPPEFFTNSEQTVGITFVAALLVLIVLIGVMLFLPTNAKD